MPLHYTLAYLAVLVVPIAVAVATFACARRGAVPVWISLAISFVGLCLSLVLVTALSWRCADSYDVVVAARTLLTPQERATLRGDEFLCPDVYLFKRGDRQMCLVPHEGRALSVDCP